MNQSARCFCLQNRSKSLVCDDGCMGIWYKQEKLVMNIMQVSMLLRISVNGHTYYGTNIMVSGSYIRPFTAYETPGVLRAVFNANCLAEVDVT